MAKALYRKWRPQTWDEVTAQEHVIQTLRNAVLNDRVAHAYLFAGPRGTGKTTTARLLAKAINCLDPDLEKRPCNQCEHCLALNAGRFMDLIEIDAASNTSVDDVRDLRDKINFSPSQGKFKVYIIDEVHMLSTAAFNALLKTLEEPPPHAIFVLATTEIHKIPATVLSRCQRHEFRRIPVKDIVELLKEKSQEEGIHVADAVYTEIARQATGSLRDAISLLDQLTSTTDDVTLEMAQNVLGTATNIRVIEIIDALIAEDAGAGLSRIHQALDSGTDPRQLARQIVTYLRNVLLFKMGNEDQIDVSEDIRPRLVEHAAQLRLPDLLRAIEAFNQATVQEHANWHPGLGLELAFTSFLAQPEPPAVMPEDPPAPHVKKAHGRTTQGTSSSENSTRESPPKKQTASSKETAPKVQTPKKTQPEMPKAEKKEPQPQKDRVEEVPDGEPDIEPPLVAADGDIAINDIHRSWAKVKVRVGKHDPRTEALLNSSRLAGLQGDILVLGFSSEILKEMMEKEGNITLTSDILEEVFGRPIPIKCVVTTRQGSSLPDDIDVDKDGMVGTATRDLGGKISSAEQDK